MNYEETEDIEYLIPSPVLTSSDKLFNFGFASFSLAQVLELAAVLLTLWGLWKALFFLPWQILTAVSIIVVVIAFLFITQPINGLPGDAWIYYALRFYAIDRSKLTLTRRGSNPIRLTHFRLKNETGQVLLQMQSGHGTEENQ